MIVTTTFDIGAEDDATDWGTALILAYATHPVRLGGYGHAEVLALSAPARAEALGRAMNTYAQKIAKDAQRLIADVRVQRAGLDPIVEPGEITASVEVTA